MDEKDLLKAKLKAGNDVELAKKLGIGKSAVSSWKTQGFPKMLSALLPYILSEDGSALSDNSADFVHVPRYEVFASAGSGTLVQSEQIVDHLAFRSEWLRETLGLSPERVAVISVKGDSMEPCLYNGDLVMVDLSTYKIESNGVYVLQIGGFLMVKRVQVKLNGEVVVKSDNPQYEPETFNGHDLERLTVVGRMVKRLVD